MMALRVPGRGELALLIAVLLTLVAAPTPGDIGGCGQAAEELNATTFFASKANLDCQRCQECNLAFASCTKACDTSVPVQSSFPNHCVPLVHDGEVCLRALYNASCDDYLTFMNDQNPVTPSECNFCPPR